MAVDEDDTGYSSPNSLLQTHMSYMPRGFWESGVQKEEPKSSIAWLLLLA